MINRLLGRPPKIDRSTWFKMRAYREDWFGGRWIRMAIFGHDLQNGKVLLVAGETLREAEYWHIVDEIWWEDREWKWTEYRRSGKIKPEDRMEIMIHPDQYVILATL